MSGSWLQRVVIWIAASDYLPSKGHCVLGTDQSGRVHEAYLSAKGKWRWAHGDTAPTITHWTELPNPPAQFELDRVAHLPQAKAPKAKGP